MLETEIKINPFGLDENNQTIAKILIGNIGHLSATGVDDFDYVYAIHSPKSVFHEEIRVSGVITSWNRKNSSVALLGAVIGDNGESSCQMSEDFMERVLCGKGEQYV